MTYTITNEGPCVGHGHDRYRVEKRGDGFMTMPPIHTIEDVLAYIVGQERMLKERALNEG